MSDALLPYYDRELNALRRLAAEFAEAHPKIAGRLRLAAGNGRRSACRAAPRGRGVPGRARPSPSRRRISRTYRRTARGALPALPCPDPVGGDPPVPGAARADAAGPASGRARCRERAGAGRDVPLPHRLAADVWPIDDRECAAFGAAAERAGQSAGGRRSQRPAHRAPVQFGAA